MPDPEIKVWRDSLDPNKVHVVWPTPESEAELQRRLDDWSRRLALAFASAILALVKRAEDDGHSDVKIARCDSRAWVYVDDEVYGCVEIRRDTVDVDRPDLSVITSLGGDSDGMRPWFVVAPDEG